MALTTSEATKHVLARLRWAGHTAARGNAGGRKGGVQLLPAGWPDVFGFAFPTGYFIGVEIKARKDDKLRTDQVRFRNRMLATDNAIWHEWRDVDEFNDWCRRHNL